MYMYIYLLEYIRYILCYATYACIVRSKSADYPIVNIIPGLTEFQLLNTFTKLVNEVKKEISPSVVGIPVRLLTYVSNEKKKKIKLNRVCLCYLSCLLLPQAPRHATLGLVCACGSFRHSPCKTSCCVRPMAGDCLCLPFLSTFYLIYLSRNGN